MKRGMPDHPKTALLMEALSLRKFQAVGIIETLYQWACRYAIRGDIGKWSNDSIAKALDWDRESDVLIEALIRCHWIDEAPPPFRLVIHDIQDHADNSWKQCLTEAGLTFWDGSPPRRGRVGRPSKNEPGQEYSRDIPEKLQPKVHRLPFPSLPLSKHTSTTSTTDLEETDEHASDATRDQASERDTAWETIYREYFIPAAKAICREGQPLGLEMREALLKASFLAATKFDKEWLLRGCKTTKRKAKTNPPAFLGSTLAKQAGMEPEDYFKMADMIRLSGCDKVSS